jgi:hypothetical protein
MMTIHPALAALLVDGWSATIGPVNTSVIPTVAMNPQPGRDKTPQDPQPDHRWRPRGGPKRQTSAADKAALIASVPLLHPFCEIQRIRRLPAIQAPPINSRSQPREPLRPILQWCGSPY